MVPEEKTTLGAESATGARGKTEGHSALLAFQHFPDLLYVNRTWNSFRAWNFFRHKARLLPLGVFR
jgi:hypothetical protein